MGEMDRKKRMLVNDGKPVSAAVDHAVAGAEQRDWGKAKTWRTNLFTAGTGRS